MLDAVGLAREVQEPAVVDDPVDDRGGHMIITEDGTPLGKRQVRRQDQTALFVALHDLECVDPGLQLPRVNQGPQDVVVEVPETQGDAA